MELNEASNLRFEMISDTLQTGFEDAFRLYEQSFPPGERERKSRFREWLGTTGKVNPAPHDFIEVARKDGKIVAMATMQYMKTIGAGFLGYLVVAPEERGVGIGTALAIRIFRDLERVHRQANGDRQCFGVFAEIDHYHARSIVRGRRLIFWQRLDLRPLNIAWRYPRLEAGTTPSAMYLAFKPLCPDLLPFSRAEMKMIAQEIYARVYRGRQSDRELKQVLHSIERGPAQIRYRETIVEES
jgi:GNAT superfamily N-acetyltransferase